MGGTAAFFISPAGEIFAPPTGEHVTSVIAEPERFGFTADQLRAIYARHGEKYGAPGKARDDILGDMFRRGWIRLRRHRDHWTVQTGALTDANRRHLGIWAAAVLKGLNDVRESDPHIHVKMETTAGECEEAAIRELCKWRGGKKA